MDWYPKAAEVLIESLEGKDEILGIEFLSEFFVSYQPEQFSESESEDSEEGSADLYARETIEGFEKYLSENHNDKVEVGKRHQWKVTSTMERIQGAAISIEDLFGTGITLTDSEQYVSQKTLTSLQENDIPALDSLYAKILGTDGIQLIAETALKVAYAYSQSDIDGVEKASKWLECADKERDANSERAYKSYERAAHLYSLVMRNELSGKCYQKAYENSPADRQMEFIRSARLQFDIAGYTEKASALYIEENNLRLKQDGWWKHIPLTIFKITSKYGESPGRVLIIAASIIFICASFYFAIGVYSSGGYFEELKDHVTENQSRIIGFETVGCMEALKISTYYSFVTFTTLGYGDFSPSNHVLRAVSAVEAVLGLLLTSLFMVSVVRKYAR